MGLTPVSGRVDLIKYFYPPVTGFALIDSLWSGQKGAFWDAVRHLILPTIVLGTVPLAVIARMTRSSMLEVLEEDYVRTARAKGLSTRRVIGVHALRNALIPVVTVIGLQAGTLLAGAVLTETIFSWPGVGKWLIESIGRRDYPALQGGIMLIATDGHRVQSAHRFPLRSDQSEDPAWLTLPHGSHQSAARPVCGILERVPRKPRRGGRADHARLHHFLCGVCSRSSPRMIRWSNIAGSPNCRRLVLRRATRGFCSARMRSGATCFRG